MQLKTKTQKEQDISNFFDKKGIVRDSKFTHDMTLKYEQDMRQRAVIELLALKNQDNVLDTGCGNARDIMLFAERSVECVGIDLSKGMVSEGKKKIDILNLRNTALIIASATNLPFKDDSFDKVSCSEVIEHIPNYEEAIYEIVRVLKLGGRLVITTPNKLSLYGPIHLLMPFLARFNKKYMHPYDKWKIQKKVCNILQKHGIEVDKKLGICYLPSQLVRLLPNRIKKIVVQVTYFIEDKIKYKLSGRGYMLGISGLKVSKFLK